jgi:DNA-binding NarL/FixJ family response regulator
MSQFPLQKITVLAVDPAEIYLQGAKWVLNHTPDTQLVAIAQYGMEAVRKTMAFSPDVILLNLHLRWSENDAQADEQGGLQTIMRILSSTPNTAILTTLWNTQPRWVVQAMNAGAKGVVDKNFSSKELVTAIRDVAQGRIVLNATQLEWWRETARLLTKREHQVLTLLATGQDDRVIAQQLAIKLPTLRKHIENIWLKLQARTRLEAILQAMRQGLI